MPLAPAPTTNDSYAHAFSLCTILVRDTTSPAKLHTSCWVPWGPPRLEGAYQVAVSGRYVRCWQGNGHPDWNGLACRLCKER